MSRETLLKRFNELLCDTTSFYNEIYGRRTKSMTVGGLTPSQVIIKLHDDGYKFTQTDIDKFLINAIYVPSNNYNAYSRRSYLLNDSYYSNNEKKQAISIMLNAQQLSYDNVQLIITKMTSSSYSYVLYEIIKSGYIYSEDQIEHLINKGFSNLIKNIYSVKFMSINVFKYCLKYCRIFGTKWIETMINKNKIIVTEDMLLNLLDNISSVANTNINTIQSELIIQFLKKISTCTNATIIKLLQSKYYNAVITILSSICSKPNIKILIELCKTGPIERIIEYVELGIKPNLECLNHAVKLPYVQLTEKDMLHRYEDCILKTGSFSIFRYMRKCGVVPDTNTLLNVCKTKKLSLFKKIVKYGIYPTQECLKYAILQENMELIEIILNNKILPPENIETFEIIMNCKLYNKILELIVSYGYELNLEMIELVFKQEKNIDGLDNLGIPYDEKLYYLCYRYNIFSRNRYRHGERYRYDENKYAKYIVKFKKELGDIIHLRLLCENSNNLLKSVKDYMINKNLKPDRYCIEYACRHNNTIAEYFIEDLKCTPTHNCIKYSSEFCNLNSVDQFKIKEFIDKLDKNINYAYMAKMYDHVDLSKLVSLIV